jgi:hypothetical protein
MSQLFAQIETFSDTTSNYETEETESEPTILQSPAREKMGSINGRIKRKMEEPKNVDTPDKLNKEILELVSESLETRTQLMEESLKELLADRVRKTAITEEEESVILAPNDSSSCLGRYKKKYMSPGTVYSFGQRETTLESVPEVKALVPQRDLIGGFIKTQKIQEREQESLARVYQINGLAAPFKSARLNFLTHFHTAFEEAEISGARDAFEALEMMAEGHSRNPTGELMKQVVNRTFDLSRQEVIANPFGLPFIELGMVFTESVLGKCLYLLQNEYLQLWFQEMKCLRVPSFHKDFHRFSTSVNRGKSKRTEPRSSNEDLAPKQRQRSESGKKTDGGLFSKSRKRRPSSVLGF